MKEEPPNPMSRRNLIRMNDEEIRAFLEEQRTLQVATIDHDGFPHLVAMWYVLVNNEIAFWTYAKSQKALNLRRDPHLTCLVESGIQYEELRGVQIKGRALLNDDLATVQKLGEAIFTRYTGPLNDNTLSLVTKQAPKRIAIFVKPVEIVSWDHSKLRGVY